MSNDRDEELRRAREQTVRNMKNISPSQFEKSIPPETLGMKVRNGFKKIFEKVIGSSSTNSSGSSYNKGSSYSSSSEFKQSYRVNTPPKQRTQEDWLIEHMNAKAYYESIDGKGDDER